MLNLSTQTAGVPALSNWTIPSLGDINAYITAANRMPMLTLAEEQEYARKYRNENDLEAAGKLVLSHLRLVVSEARKCFGYGLPHEDLIQEGNIGLMKAVKGFDPDQGSRLVTYALHWIKADIREYVLKNSCIVKLATTRAQRKLFFNLRSMKQRFRAQDAANAGTPRETLTSEQADIVAAQLHVSREEVLEMETRLSGGDVVLEHFSSDSDDDFAAPIDYLIDDSREPTVVLAANHRELMANDGIACALDLLDDRSRRIIEARWINVDDNNNGGMTLHELAAVYGVSAERIRQIETQAMKKMKKSLVEYS